jgi:hypothetical protein
MARVTLTLFCSLCFLSPALASRAPRPERLDLGRPLPFSLTRDLPPDLPLTASARPQKDEFQVTEDTAVTLDGRPCKYRDVPANATIIKMEVGPDKKTVVKIHFHSGR